MPAHATRWPCRSSCPARRCRLPVLVAHPRAGPRHPPGATAGARGPRQLGQVRGHLAGRALPRHPQGLPARAGRGARRVARPPTARPRARPTSGPSRTSRWRVRLRPCGRCCGAPVTPASCWSPARAWPGSTCTRAAHPGRGRRQHPDSGDARLALGVRLDGEWYAADDLDLLGEAAPAGGHGVAVWSPADPPTGWVLALAPLARGSGPRSAGWSPVATGRGPGHRPGRPVSRLPAPAAPARARSVLRRVRRPPRAGGAPARAHRDLGVRRAGGAGLGVALPASATPTASTGWPRPRAAQLPPARAESRRCSTRWHSTKPSVHRLCRAHPWRGSRRRSRCSPASTPSPSRSRCCQGSSPAARSRSSEVGDRPDYREAESAPVVRFVPRRTDAEDAEGGDANGPTDWLDLEVLISVDGDSLALPALLQALTHGHDRVILRTGVHVAVNRPEFAHLAELVAAAGELHEQPPQMVRVSHHDLQLWNELDEIGLVDAQASQWVEAARALTDTESLPRRRTRRTRGGAAPLPARRLPLAGVLVAGAARRDPGRRHGARQDPADPGPGRARPGRGCRPVPGRRTDERGLGLGPRSRPVHPGSRRARGLRVAGPAGRTDRGAGRGRRPGRHLLHALPPRGRRTTSGCPGAGWSSTRPRWSRTTRARPTRRSAAWTCRSGWRCPARRWRTA